MVFYHTSGNIKILKSIFIEYDESSDVTPYEFATLYIEKCTDTIEDSKLCWIVETFIGVQKHRVFLNEIISCISDELSDDEQYYCMIILYAVIFQIGPKDTQNVYKCLFNLSKPLLETIINFMSSNESLTIILQIAHLSYDTNFIEEKIVQPLSEWQPYGCEMVETYTNYVKKKHSKKYKIPTIPMQPNVLNRKAKKLPSLIQQISLPVTPPNSLHNKSRKMLTKSAIDLQINHLHEKNKQKADKLLHIVKNTKYHYAEAKSGHDNKRLSGIKNEAGSVHISPLPRIKPNNVGKTPLIPVKDTTATIKIMYKRMQKVEEAEIEWLHNLVSYCENTNKVEELEEFDRKEREQERILNIERKHLLGQITHEEAQIAKNKLQEDNRHKYAEFLKEKALWNAEIDNWRKLELEENRKRVERLSLIELNLLQAKSNVTAKKKESADKLKKESEIIISRVMKEKHEELERRINMIKEIKILAMIAKTAKVPKVIDLTETSGLGLLCEMSIVELQERLSMVKIELQDELERKKKAIQDTHIAAKKEREHTKNSIKKYLAEQEALRKQNSTSKISFKYTQTKEIIDLKRTLEQKRKQRMKLSH